MDGVEPAIGGGRGACDHAFSFRRRARVLRVVATGTVDRPRGRGL